MIAVATGHESGWNQGVRAVALPLAGDLVGHTLDWFRKLDDNAQARRKELGGSDPARLTEELADKFDLNNGDKK